MFRFLTIILLLLPFGGLRAQTDSLTPTGERALAPALPAEGQEASAKREVSPKKVALFSAIVPGLGQYQNKQYWKIPIVYAGVGVAIYFLQDNIKNHNLYRKLSVAYINGDTQLTATSKYNEREVNLLRDYYRRNLDLTAVLSALGYTLQVIDALAFAHLKDFDISEDISFRARPVIYPEGGLGLALVLRF